MGFEPLLWPWRRGWRGILLLAIVMSFRSNAQYPGPTPNDTLHSVSIVADGRVTFRLYAPHADTVALGGGDIVAPPASRRMVRDSGGIWEITLPPLAPGAYRYDFAVDGISGLDPRNPSVSESNNRAWSLLYVPGADYMETKDVPHGAVSEVTYYSTSLQRFRRMHVYTPPGYESGKGKYPVFYLLHGAFDCDDAWTTVGRAGFILDNLIAAGKAVPMVVIMPAGHTGPFSSAGLGRPPSRPRRDEFEEDFLTDVKPYAEKHYRVIADRDHRAIAGLSMGGAQTLNIAISHLADYAYIGVYSSGVFELGGRDPFAGSEKRPSWEERNRKSLDDMKLKKGLHLVWFAIGKEDFLFKTSQATVSLLRQHGFDVVSRETGGGHTWINWREYLAAFAPLLFQSRGR